MLSNKKHTFSHADLWLTSKVLYCEKKVCAFLYSKIVSIQKICPSHTYVIQFYLDAAFFDKNLKLLKYFFDLS